MTYTSVGFFILLIVSVIAYYIVPLKYRWAVLLSASVLFYYMAAGLASTILIALTVVISYGLAGVIARSDGNKRRTLFVLALIIVIIPLFITKSWTIIGRLSSGISLTELIAPLGISYYTLQIVSYLTDVYMRRTDAAVSILKYALYILFFPHIVQGPIPRYSGLSHELFEGHVFREENIVKGVYLITWGFFLKYMIAERAAMYVNAIHSDINMYGGTYLWLGAFLYSIQLYADFSCCVYISRGASRFFGISIENNFARPFFATSIKEIWSRWHITFSNWLRDYIYFPLGGSRKGKLRKLCNLMIVFLISGLWHGFGLSFLAWGGILGVFRIVGEWTPAIKRKVFGEEKSAVLIWAERIVTFILWSVAFVMFRAESLLTGIKYYKNMFTVYNPWVLSAEYLDKLGFECSDRTILTVSILVLFVISLVQEKNHSISEWVCSLKPVTRGALIIIVICIVYVFGIYGYGFDASEFIYGGF